MPVGDKLPNPLAEAGLVVFWSSGFIGAALAAETESLTAMVWRFAILTLLLAPFGLSAVRRAGRGALVRAAVVGAFGVFAYLAAVTVAIDLGLSAGVTALICALQPLTTAALAGVVLGERVRALQWVGLVVGFAGVAVAVGGGQSAPPGPALLAVFAMLALVCGTLIAKRAPVVLPIPATLFVHAGLTTLLTAPLALASGGSLVPPADPMFALAVAWWIILSSCLGWGLYWLVLSRTSATRVSSLIYLTPPVTALWATLMLGAPLEPSMLVGFAICLTGVMLAGGRLRLSGLPGSMHRG